MVELQAAAHKQGFGSLDEVDSAILDPGGSICFSAKKPTPDRARHGEIMARLDQISAQLTALRLEDHDEMCRPTASALTLERAPG